MLSCEVQESIGTENISHADDDIVQFFPLILMLVQREVPHSIGPLDSEDIAQEVFIRFLVIWRKQSIESPKAYIRKIVHAVIVDMVRKYKPHLYQGLCIDENGEICEGYLVTAVDIETSNPENVLIQKEALDEFMNDLMDVVSNLPTRQRQATVARLGERVDDLISLVDALQGHAIESEVEWPDEPIERQRLQACFSHARRNIARQLDVELAFFDKRQQLP